MNARLLYLLIFLLGLSACSEAPEPPSGFAGLGTEVEGYPQVSRNDRIRFPEALGAHPEYRIEWWYVTANLTDENGQDWGIQWTLFRQALQPNQGKAKGWQTPQVWMGHAAITSATHHWQAERLSRGGTGEADAQAQPFKAWIHSWRLSSQQEASFSPLEVYASDQDFAYRLQLSTDQPFVLQGDQGYSQKSEQGQASWYYSQPFFKVEGQIEVDDQQLQVRGQGWMDREWSSQPLAPGQEGWDWFSLHLETGEKVMLFQLREDGKDYYSGTWISAAGEPTPLEPEQIQMQPLELTRVAGRQLPTHWRLQIADYDLDITTRPLNAKSFMDTLVPYWEGPIFFEGSHQGRGFLEMTGY
ncbi:Predicted secreted hydrolase [Marinospirillum celere]|uniref:Predicted secreted hydrolase n=1 Tax=Marinospirillum celere TaxID=1122252 RepID=A0A1I1E5L7_9GAMM|nr:lipocalin-like domain-containing protein [Marinospirillum celere]SFB82525.1 Predicted secreted hydrolase [Marinospirillum celere]